MRFRNGFGEEKVVDKDDLRDGYDRVVPNGQLNLDRNKLLDRWNRFQPVVDDFQRYDENQLSLSAYDDIRDREFKSAVFDGDILLAMKAEIENHPQYFPTTYFYQRLKEREQSIVRFRGSPEPTYFNVEIDTRDRNFDAREPELEFDTEIFKHEYIESSTFTTDFVTPVEGLTGMSSQRYSDVVAGLITSYQPLDEYIQEEFRQISNKFEIKTVATYFYRGDTVIAGGRRHEEKGKEIFLTKQGYQYFLDNGLAIVRAERDEDRSRWTDLEILVHPTMEANP